MIHCIVSSEGELEEGNKPCNINSESIEKFEEWLLLDEPSNSEEEHISINN